MRVCPICQTTRAGSDGLCAAHQLALIPRRLLEILDQAPLLGHTLDNRYVLHDLVGQGGMGVIYLARQRPLNREVAIKVLDRAFTATEKARERFEREARSICNLKSHYTVTLHDYGVVKHETQGEMAFMVMEHVEGESLATRLEEGSIPLPEIRLILDHTARSLTEAHRQGILHRDIKPSNILLTQDPDGRPMVKLIDFGIAQVQGATGEGAAEDMAGTPHYMAPEIFDARHSPDIRADVYAVGVVLYEMITGRRPFRGKTPVSLIVQHRTANVPYLPGYKTDHAHRALNPVIQRAMAKDPDARYPTVQALFDAVELAMRRAQVPMLDQGSPPTEEITEINLPPEGVTDTNPALNDHAAAAQRHLKAPLTTRSDEEPGSGPDVPVQKGQVSPSSDPFEILPPETDSQAHQRIKLTRAERAMLESTEDPLPVMPSEVDLEAIRSPYRRWVYGLATLCLLLLGALFYLLNEQRNAQRPAPVTRAPAPAPAELPATQAPPGSTAIGDEADQPGGGPDSMPVAAPPPDASAAEIAVQPDAEVKVEIAARPSAPGKPGRSATARR